MGRELLYMQDLTVEEKNGNRLYDMNLLLREGTCVCLAGTSGQRNTLVRFLQGEGSKISGRLYVGGAELGPGGRAELERNKVFVIGRDVPYMESLNIPENIFLLRRNRLRNVWANERAMREQAGYYLQKYGIMLDIGADAPSMGAGDKALVGMVRAAAQNARVLVLADLSGIFSFDGLGTVLDVARKLKEEGMGIIISDSNPELFYPVADMLAIFRHKKIAKKIYDREDFGLAEKIIFRGMDRPRAQQPGNHAGGCAGDRSPFLKICWEEAGDGQCELLLRRGEIVLASGTAAKMEQLWEKIICGGAPEVSYILNGEPVKYRTVDGLIRKGIVPVQFDTKDSGVFKNMTNDENILLPSLRRIAGPAGFYKRQGNYILRDNFLFQDGESQDTVDRREEGRKLIFYRWKLYHPKAVIFYNVFTLSDFKEKDWLKRIVASMAKRGTAVLLLEFEKDFCSAFADRVEGR